MWILSFLVLQAGVLVATFDSNVTFNTENECQMVLSAEAQSIEHDRINIAKSIGDEYEVKPAICVERRDT